MKTKKTYQERKQDARNIVLQWMEEERETIYSWEGYIILSAYFRRLGKAYGLLKEFRENGIPC